MSVLLNAGNGNFTGQSYFLLATLDTITGTTGVDQITISQDPDHAHIDWTLNGTSGGQLAINDPNGLTINGNGSNDVITLDYTNGDPFPNKLILNGVFTLNNMAITGNPLANTTIDLKTSTLFINYFTPVDDPLSLIQGYLNTGYNNGTWTGTSANGSILSSSAALNPNNFAIGYADSADAGNPANIATSNAIELRYAGVGDTNLNGTVDINDYNAVVRNFGVGTMWDQGDVTYDSTVSINDYNAIVRHFGDVVTSPSASPAAVPVFSTAVLTSDTATEQTSTKPTSKIRAKAVLTLHPIAHKKTHKTRLKRSAT